MSSARRPRLLLTCLLIPLAFATGVRGQTGLSNPSLSSADPSKRLSLSLFGGWASFSQTSVNNQIRMENLALTLPVSENGAGLDRGLDQITDVIRFEN